MAEEHERSTDVAAPSLELDLLLARVRFQVDEGHPHIQLQPEDCRQCDLRPCLRVCPAGVYRLGEEGMEAHWQRCLECGSCRQVCAEPTLHWEHPRGGQGVSYRLG